MDAGHDVRLFISSENNARNHRALSAVLPIIALADLIIAKWLAVGNNQPRFSQAIQDFAKYPSNQGALGNATHIGRASRNGNPPFVTVYLATIGGRISKATFESAGCGVTTAVGSVVTETIIDWSLDECRKLDAGAICKSLEGVPPDKMHCVHVVLAALADALGSEQSRGPALDEGPST